TENNSSFSIHRSSFIVHHSSFKETLNAERRTMNGKQFVIQHSAFIIHRSSFMLLATIAWRNLWRNPRRTLLTALALGLGLALLLIAVGLNDGRNEQMIANGVRLGSGHVVVQAKGYQETRSQELLLPASLVSATEE